MAHSHFMLDVLLQSRDELVRRVRESGDPQFLFRNSARNSDGPGGCINILAALSPEERSKTITELQVILGDQLDMHTLEGAIAEAQQRWAEYLPLT
jgi:hypothetical protein